MGILFYFNKIHEHDGSLPLFSLFFPSADTVLLPENKDAASPTSVKTDESSKTQLSELETSVAEFLNKSEVNIFDKQIF